MQGLDYAITLLSLIPGVRAVERAEEAVNIYVDSVDDIYPEILSIMRRHAPDVYGQVRGPTYPMGPPDVSPGIH